MAVTLMQMRAETVDGPRRLVQEAFAAMTVMVSLSTAILALVR